jgi:hypothetical protein
MLNIRYVLVIIHKGNVETLLDKDANEYLHAIGENQIKSDYKNT